MFSETCDVVSNVPKHGVAFPTTHLHNGRFVDAVSVKEHGKRAAKRVCPYIGAFDPKIVFADYRDSVAKGIAYFGRGDLTVLSCDAEKVDWGVGVSSWVIKNSVDDFRPDSDGACWSSDSSHGD